MAERAADMRGTEHAALEQQIAVFTQAWLWLLIGDLGFLINTGLAACELDFFSPSKKNSCAKTFCFRSKTAQYALTLETRIRKEKERQVKDQVISPAEWLLVCVLCPALLGDGSQDVALTEGDRRHREAICLPV